MQQAARTRREYVLGTGSRGDGHGSFKRRRERKSNKQRQLYYLLEAGVPGRLDEVGGGGGGSGLLWI